MTKRFRSICRPDDYSSKSVVPENPKPFNETYANKMKEDEELDQYLDDVLEEFNGTEMHHPEVENVQKQDDQEAFLELLQKNMSKLLEDGENNDESRMAIINELENSRPFAPAASVSTPPAIPGRPAPTDFQEQISQTLNKLKLSSNAAEAKSKSKNPTHDLFGAMDDDSMEQMMKELEGMMETGEFEDMFGGLYPEWLSENKGILSNQDLDRYFAQHKLVVQIVQIFETCEGNEPNEQDSQKIIDLMQEMQSHGNPPEGLMKSLVPEMDPPLGSEASECKNM